MNRDYSSLESPQIIKGGVSVDARGSVSFVNDFAFNDVKRFYIIKHSLSKTIRAWQAHKKEIKFFYVLKGEFQINLIKIDNWEKPKKGSEVINYRLSRKNNSVLVIPKGYVNGFMNLEGNSELLVFSSSTLEESLNDDFRFDVNYFKNSNW